MRDEIKAAIARERQFTDRAKVALHQLCKEYDYDVRIVIYPKEEKRNGTTTAKR